jgi:UDP-glucose 4-epimerase
MKNILIIGGSGYIGSRLYDYLLNFGYKVTNMDLCWFGKTHNEIIVDDYKNIISIDQSQTCIEIMNERYPDIPHTFKCRIFNLQFYKWMYVQ